MYVNSTFFLSRSVRLHPLFEWIMNFRKNDVIGKKPTLQLFISFWYI
jgi:hypothetical protein